MSGHVEVRFCSRADLGTIESGHDNKSAPHGALTPSGASPTEIGHDRLMETVLARTDTTPPLDGDIPGTIGGGCVVDDCGKPVVAHSFCPRHYKRWYRYGDPHTGRQVNPPLTAGDLEDIEWMVETGESLTGAARRCHRSVEALCKALTRAQRRDLTAALAAREGDWNSAGRLSHMSRAGAA